MQVILITHTPDPEKLVASAARLCYSKTGIKGIMDSISPEKIGQRIRDCYKKGHHSIFEHASFSFAIEGISRVASHQIVRHRIASYSQQSQRYVDLRETAGFIIPPSVKKNKLLEKKFVDHLKKSIDIYKELQKFGIQSEDARFVFPQSVETKLILTMNARELIHFFNLRCCSHSQWEIRSLAYGMLNLVKKAAPNIFEKAGPFCFSGSCPENDTECFAKMKKNNKT